MRANGALCVLAGFAGFAWSAALEAQTNTLRNESYQVAAADDGTLRITAADGAAAEFRPRFAILFTPTDPQIAKRPANIKGVPYNVPTWKTGIAGAADVLGHVDTARTAGDGFDNSILEGDQDGRTANLFGAAPTATAIASGATVTDGRIQWRFANQAAFSLSAEVSLPPGRAEPVLSFQFTPAKAGWYSVGYIGAPRSAPEQIDEMWQPLIWQEKRFPDRPYLTAAFKCPIPATFVTRAGTTTGVVVDPAELPFQPLPTFANSRFGVAVRDASGGAQSIVLAPILGGEGSQMAAGRTFTLRLHLLVRKGGCIDAYEHAARRIYAFRDHRRNTLTSLNQTIQNMIEYGLSDYSRFNEELRGCAYDTDVAGSVKNVSALYPMAAAIVTDDPEVYARRARPIMEYLLSREKFLFVVDPSIKVQDPSWKLLGPCSPPADLASLYLLTGQRNPVLLHHAQQLADKALTWPSQLALYRATGERAHLEQATRLADEYLQRRMGSMQSEFAPAFFWTSFSPLWIELLELYEETGERRFLDASRAGARQFAQFIWMCPRIPEAEITVNEGGQAPEYWYLKKRGLGPMRIAEQTVPAWRLSEIGLTPESSGTASGHRAIFMAHHAPWMLRLAYLTNDSFLHDIARSAVIGRYASFPGYHINTARTTVYEQPDYPLHEFRELTYNSFHFNHVWPQIAFLIDYLVSDTYARSAGRIDFPSRFAEGYGYLKSKVYGDRPGRFYDDPNVWLWMPRDLLKIDNVQLNYLAGRSDGRLYLAFANQGGEDVTARVRINEKLVTLAGPSLRTFCGTAALEQGALQVTVPAGGLTALVIEGIQIRPRFQGVSASADERLSSDSFARLDLGGTHGMLLSMGAAHTSAYVYCQATFEEFKSVTLSYRTTAGWQDIADTKYPFEFTVPLAPEDREFEFYVEAEKLDGQRERSSAARLKR